MNAVKIDTQRTPITTLPAYHRALSQYGMSTGKYYDFAAESALRGHKITATPKDYTRISARKKNTTERSAKGNIRPADYDVSQDKIERYDAEPIKSVEDIKHICTYLIDNKRWRDHMLFVLGINFGLRISDLTRITFAHILNDDMSYKSSFEILEKKTANTRKKKKNRCIYINEAVMDAVDLYLENTQDIIYMDTYLFRAESANATRNTPITRQGVHKLLKNIQKECGLEGMRFSSHSLRKTFGYHQMMMANNDPRKLMLLQKMFGHSTSRQTMDYIGLTEEEMTEAYRNLNLGGNDYSEYESFIGDVFSSPYMVKHNLPASTPLDPDSSEDEHRPAETLSFG